MEALMPVGRRIGTVSAAVLLVLTFSVPQPAQARDDSHSLTAAVGGLELTVFGSKVTIASSSAAIEGKTAARANAAGVMGSSRTLASAKVTELNKRERAQQCLPELAMFNVLRVQMACGESRVQTLPALVPDEYRQPTGAALLGRVQPARDRVPTTIDNGGPQAVGRGSVARVDLDDRSALEPSLVELQRLLDALTPVRAQTVEAAKGSIGPDLRKVLEPLATSLGLRPNDKVGSVATVVGQLLEGTRGASVLASVKVADSSAQANSDEAKVVALATAGGGQIDVLPGFAPGGAPLLSVIVGPAKSVSTFDRATAARTPTEEPAETRIMLGLPIAGDDRPELVVRPGTAVTLLAGTPLQTTVSAGQGRHDRRRDGSVVSSVGPTSVQLLGGVKGGITVELGQIEAAVGAQFDPEGEAKSDAVMDRSPLAVGAGSLLAAFALAVVTVVVSRRRASRARPRGQGQGQGQTVATVGGTGRTPTRVHIVIVATLLAAQVSLLALPDDTTKAALTAQTGATGGAALGSVADLTWGISRAEVDRTVAGLRDAGFRWVRANQNWAGGEPDAKGVLNTGWLAEIDYAVKKATTAGLQVLMPISDGVPYWASADPAKNIDASGTRNWNKLWRPTKSSDYADFAAAMVKRYKPLGVRVYEVWNEPNHSWFWPSGPNAAEYVSLLSAAYPAMKAADPSATVLLGGLSKSDWDYMDRLYAAGAKPYFDAVAIHPYSADPTWCWNQAGTTKLAKDAFCGIEEVRRSMEANGDSAKKMWLTEFGWSTTTAEYGVTEAAQADFLTKAVTTIRTSYPYVATAFWYNFRNTYYYNNDPLEIEANFGLVRTDYQPKPALAAIKTFAVPLPPPSISINDVTVVEGGAGTKAKATFTLSLNTPAGQPVTVKAATANATAVAGSDYTAVASTTITFAPGASTATLDVPITGDNQAEGNETFVVNLSSPVEAVLGDVQGRATILDEEGLPTVRVDEVSVIEGAAGTTTNAGFRVSLSAAGTKTITVSAATENGSATAGSDYTARGATTLSFAPGETMKTFDVAVTGDSGAEGSENFFVRLSEPAGAVLADADGMATILDDEGPPTVSVSDASVLEGKGNASFNLSLSSPGTRTISVTAATANGTAAAGADYTALAPTTVNFAPGEVMKTVTVPVADDSAVEGDEKFVLNLSAPVAAVLADAHGVATIIDDEGTPTISVDDVAVTEGAPGTTATATFKVALSATPGTTITVKAATGDRTASSTSDYTALPLTTLIFAPGERSKTVAVSVKGDSTAEGNETFVVNLSSPVGAVLADGQGLGTILEDDGLLPGLAPPPGVSISDATVVEGTDGMTTNAIFTVSLSAPAPLLITVGAATANGSAVAGSDYTALPALTAVAFALGESSKTLTVPVAGDALTESKETFVVNLSGPLGAVLADAQGLGTILEVPPPPVTISVNDISVAEGNTGTTTRPFTVSLSRASTETITVRAATANGSASAGSDYDAVAPTTLTFAPGETTKSVNVAVRGDGSTEGTETFVLNLSTPVNAVLADAQGLAAILDDEGAPTVWVDDVSVVEGAGGAAARFRLHLSAPVAQPVSFKAATADTLASGGSDYTPLALTTFTFAVGETEKTIDVPVTGDSLAEGDKSFSLNLSSPVGAALSDTRGTATILDDEGAPTISIQDASVSEGAAGTTATATFTLSLSAPAPATITVRAATANGSATSPGDYTALPLTTVTFAKGETTKTLAVAVNGDTLAENNETFLVNLSGPVGAVLSDDQAVGTIVNDPSAPVSVPAPRQDVVWTAGAGVGIDGNDLTKTAATGWGNSGAVSRQAIQSGDGFVEFTASETNTYRMIGLSNGDSGQSYTDIDFAVHAAVAGIQVYEKGVYRGAFGPYVSGDVLSVVVEAGTVTYRKNGTVLYRSTAQPVYPLLVDTSLYSPNATLRDVVVSGNFASMNTP